MLPGMDDRLAAAVRENVEWCDLVCRAHGVPTRFDRDVWRAERRSPPFYPDAMTLTPAATAADVLRGIDLSPGCSVKDSFAALDLTAAGFEVLFGAAWIHRPAAPPAVLPVWRRDPADLPDDPSVTAFAGPGGRVVAHLSGTVVGLSNLTGEPAGEAWEQAVAATAAAWPDRPIVGYEPADAVPAGFTPTGPLRVWMKR